MSSSAFLREEIPAEEMKRLRRTVSLSGASVFGARVSVREILFLTFIFGVASELRKDFAGEDLNVLERTEVRSTFVGDDDGERDILFLGPSDVLRGARESGRDMRSDELLASRPSKRESRSRDGLGDGLRVRPTGEKLFPTGASVSFFRGVVLVERGSRVVVRGEREEKGFFLSRSPNPEGRPLGLRSVLGDGDDNVSLFFGPVEVFLGELLLFLGEGDDFVKGN